MIEEAINYPRRGDDATRTILIGGVLGMLSVLVVPTVLVSGYLVRVLRGTMNGDEAPPEFDEWGDLLLDGVKATVVALAYSLLPMLVFVVAVGGAAASAIAAGELSPGVIAGSFLGVLVSGVLWLAAWYVLPAALANFVREERLSAAFALGDLRPILVDGEYAVGWLVAFLFLLVAGGVAATLNGIPVLGFVAGAFVFFYASVAASYVYGRAFDAARSTADVSEAPTGRPVA